MAWEELVEVNPSATLGKGQSFRKMVEGLKKESKEVKACDGVLIAPITHEYLTSHIFAVLNRYVF